MEAEAETVEDRLEEAEAKEKFTAVPSLLILIKDGRHYWLEVYQKTLLYGV